MEDIAVKLREVVLEQINHRQTTPVLYTLIVEEEVGEKLDVHYGGPEWRTRLTPYLAYVPSGVTSFHHEPIGDGLARDIYGAVWRIDRRPWHLKETPLTGPSFEGYDFPGTEAFIHPELKGQGLEAFTDQQ